MVVRLAKVGPPPDGVTDQARRYTRRLSDKILIAFHRACDQRDVEVAWELLNTLEFMAMRQSTLPAGKNRRVKESLISAHERLWHIQHPGLAEN
jgi:hypothetical protein